MSRAGDNLPSFRDAQLRFAAHIRDPEHEPRPNDIEARRMRVYVELFYNNVEHFAATAFPVTKRLLDGTAWHALVRGFLREHRATTPYFQEISQEFLEYVATQEVLLERTPYLLELMHYEWVELALSISTDDWPSDADRNGSLLDDIPIVTSLVWPLSYRYPVHRIGPDFRPSVPPPDATHLVVYRNRNDDVKFLETNATTLRLIALLAERRCSGRAALVAIAQELGRDPAELLSLGSRTLDELCSCDIIAGTRIAPQEP
jgi:hypothetical protein